MAATHREWMKEEHPIYRQWKETWKENERRLRGGKEVLEELRRFDWEKKGMLDDTAYRHRQSSATYINFPDMHGAIITGHMNREAPSPDGALNFGSLGSPETGDRATPDRAHDVYFNVDGRGRIGSQWDPWWMSVTKRAMGTGHRWLYCEAPAVLPASRADELLGKRPYLIEYSPMAVPLWDEDDGQFNYFVIKVRMRSARLAKQGGGLEEGGKYRIGYLLFVRKGYDGLNYEDDNFTEGGWWKFDPDLEYIKGDDGRPLHGGWDSTAGEIPMWPYFAEQDDGSDEVPAMSRPMLTSLGQVAVSYMNLSSAADYDAWDAGQSVAYLLGIPPEAHREVAQQLKDGSKVIGVPLTTDDQGNVHLPGLQDGSQGAVSSTVWEQRLGNKWKEARTLAAMEATGDPAQSGTSKRMSFEDMMSPRLASLASNLESAQRAAIYFLERRYTGGRAPTTGSVTWVRSFQLRNIIEDINAIFNAEEVTGYKNPRLGAKLLTTMVHELGLESDPKELDKIEKEYEDAAQMKQEADAAMRQALTMAPPTGDYDEDDEE